MQDLTAKNQERSAYSAERPEGSPPPELPDCDLIVHPFPDFVNSSSMTNW